MYISLANTELGNFPQDVYTYEPDPLVEPTLVSVAPYKFKLIAQEVDNKTYELFGEVTGDTALFISEALVTYQDELDVPEGFSQRVLPGSYGDKLNLAEIASAIKNETRAQLTVDVAISVAADKMDTDGVTVLSTYPVGTVLTFDADSEARNNLTGALITAGNFGLTETNWRMSNNELVKVALSDLKTAQGTAMLALGSIVA